MRRPTPLQPTIPTLFRQFQIPPPTRVASPHTPGACSWRAAVRVRKQLTRAHHWEAQMDSPIDRLLQEFDKGRITRRDMLRALGLAALAVPAASFAQGTGRGDSTRSRQARQSPSRPTRPTRRRRSTRPAGRRCGSTTSPTSARTTQKRRRSTRRSWDGRCGATTASRSSWTSATTSAASS